MGAKVDPKKVEEFAGRFLGNLNGASLVQLASVGHQTGLFDVMAELKPSTSAEIAAKARLNERYVREWLNGLAAGKIVIYHPKSRKYSLPPEHAACLARSAGPNNMARYAQVFPWLGSVEGKVVRSFKNGGGVPYSAYSRFQEIASEFSGATFDANLISKTLPLAPGAVARLRKGIDVADVGCGVGHAINLMAREFPKSRFVGYDFSGDGIKAARAEANRLKLRNAEFVVQDVAKLNVADRYDLITVFDAIHDQAQPSEVLANINRALKPGGMFLMVDVAGSSNVGDNLDHPLAPFIYTVSVMHCMTVSLALDGEGLGAMWGEQKARELLKQAGFKQVSVKRLEGDIMNNYYVTRKA